MTLNSLKFIGVIIAFNNLILLIATFFRVVGLGVHRTLAFFTFSKVRTGSSFPEKSGIYQLITAPMLTHPQSGRAYEHNGHEAN